MLDEAVLSSLELFCVFRCVSARRRAKQKSGSGPVSAGSVVPGGLSHPLSLRNFALAASCGRLVLHKLR